MHSINDNCMLCQQPGTCTQMHTCAHMRTHAHTCAHMRTHAHTCTHTHMWEYTEMTQPALIQQERPVRIAVEHLRPHTVSDFQKLLSKIALIAGETRQANRGRILAFRVDINLPSLPCLDSDGAWHRPIASDASKTCVDGP